MGEKDFSDWIDSIEFVDNLGKVISVKLEKDDSDDFEDDRVE